MENQFCGRCGATLQALAPYKNRELRRYDDSARQLKQIGQTVAVSLLALAAEAGLAYLRRRLEGQEGAAQETGQSLQPVERPTPTSSTQPTAVSLRVTEVHRNGRLVQRTIEKAAWWWRDA